jgi:hypothetical protein
MTPVDTLGEPVTVVDTLGEPVVLINNDGTPAFLAYSAKTYLGGVAPYHWLDFVNNRALYAGADVGNVTQATGYSFSRASEGYYTNSDGTLTSFASGALRRGDRGVLIEGARTNLLVRSQEFDDAAWVKINQNSATSPVITANAGLAPDGTMTAERAQFERTGTGAADRSRLEQTNIPIAASTVYTFSVWLKSFDGTNQTVSIFPNFGLGSAVALTVTNEWQRFQVSANSSVSITATCVIGLGYVANSVLNADVLIWGAQLEAASFASSYIPTVAAASTRASDVLTYTAGVSYPASMWAEFSQDVLAGGGSNRIFQIDDGSINNRATLYMSTNVVTFRVSTSGSNVATVLVSGAISASVVYKAAGRAATDDVRVYRNATQGTQDTSAALPASPTTARVGVGVTTDEELFGYIRRIAIFNSALTDAQLTTTTS